MDETDETIIEIKNDKSTATEEQLKLISSILLRAKNNGLNYINGAEMMQNFSEASIRKQGTESANLPPRIEYKPTFQVIMNSGLEIIKSKSTGRRLDSLPDEETLALIGFFNYYTFQLNSVGTTVDIRYKRVNEELEKLDLQNAPEWLPKVKEKFLGLIKEGYRQLIPQVNMQLVSGSARTNICAVYAGAKLEIEPKKY